MKTKVVSIRRLPRAATIAAALLLALPALALLRGPLAGASATAEADDGLSLPLIAAEARRSSAADEATPVSSGDDSISARVRQTIAAAAQHPADAARRLAAAEALLAAGDPASAQREALAVLRLTAANRDQFQQHAMRACRLWTIARLRQGASLEDATIAAALGRLGDEPGLAALRYWRAALVGRRPYRIETTSRDAFVSIQHPAVWSRLAARRIDGVTAHIGSVELPLVLIDTGAQYTILSREAAESAGVVFAESESAMVGFGSFSARPAIVPRFELGGLVLRDVPVFVADSPGLVRVKGQMALGIDLLHHLRITLDLDAGWLSVAPLGTPAESELSPESAGWQARLWPWPQVCLAEGNVAGHSTRVLIDTGNWEGTFISTPWAERCGIPLPSSGQRKPAALAGLSLAGRDLGVWPVRGVLPSELDRLQLIDVLVGHDLLAGNRVTIDLAAGLLRCERSEP